MMAESGTDGERWGLDGDSAYDDTLQHIEVAGGIMEYLEAMRMGDCRDWREGWKMAIAESLQHYLKQQVETEYADLLPKTMSCECFYVPSDAMLIPGILRKGHVWDGQDWIAVQQIAFVDEPVEGLWDPAQPDNCQGCGMDLLSYPTPHGPIRAKLADIAEPGGCDKDSTPQQLQVMMTCPKCGQVDTMTIRSDRVVCNFVESTCVCGNVSYWRVTYEWAPENKWFPVGATVAIDEEFARSLIE